MDNPLHQPLFLTKMALLMEKASISLNLSTKIPFGVEKPHLNPDLSMKSPVSMDNHASLPDHPTSCQTPIGHLILKS